MSRKCGWAYLWVRVLVCGFLGMWTPATAACQPVFDPGLPWPTGGVALTAVDRSGVELGVHVPSGLSELRTSFIGMRGTLRDVRGSIVLVHTGYDRLGRYAAVTAVDRRVPGAPIVRAGGVLAVQQFVQRGANNVAEVTVGASATVEPEGGLRMAGRALLGPGRVHGSRAARLQVAARMNVSRLLAVHVAADRPSDDGAAWHAGIGLREAGPVSAMVTLGSGTRLLATSVVVRAGRLAALLGWWYSHPVGSTKVIVLGVELEGDEH